MCFAPKCTQSTFILSHAAACLVVQYLVEKKASLFLMAFVLLALTGKALPALGLNTTTEVIKIPVSLQLTREQRWESSQLWIFLPFPLILK